MSHHTNRRNPTAAAQPVIRCRIDSDIVYMNLYTPRCGDTGRWFIVPPQKSTQRPFFSQSPKRVGSGPGGPPISAGGTIPAACRGSRGAIAQVTARVTAETLGESTSEGTFGTGANSARIAPSRPYETPSKTKMSTPAGIDLSSPPDGLGVLAFRGNDAAKFLQGQLSANVETLAAGASTLAGLHNPQGRVIALLAVVRTSADE